MFTIAIIQIVFKTFLGAFECSLSCVLHYHSRLNYHVVGKTSFVVLIYLVDSKKRVVSNQRELYEVAEANSICLHSARLTVDLNSIEVLCLLYTAHTLTARRKIILWHYAKPEPNRCVLMVFA